MKLCLDKRAHLINLYIMLSVSEIFYSLQGEGPYVGYPALFIRLAGCIKPFCPWCDTPYAYYISQGEHMSNEQILSFCRNILANQRSGVFSELSEKILIVMTGGEPFLQWGRQQEELIEIFLSSGYWLQYETSGRVQIPSISTDSCKIVVSPKYLKGGWDFLSENVTEADFFKFVLNNGNEMSLVLQFIQNYDIDPSSVYLMPRASNKTELDKVANYVGEISKQYGLKFSPRLQLELFGGKEGV